MNPVKPKKKQAAQDALDVLEQAFAYYTPEPLPAVEEADPGEWVIEYYQAA
ncbi:hypothetical protein J4729_02965 [Leisingera sp. HS039]|uniref:hypothetical protein n=1 Tax=unclassified Leisingera TaxID=2614906 RepID=UPI001430BEA3|nr:MULTISPECIES: hypothetical protein [unclassified Leisingera]MBQ4823517.1 hypothetical protein [Leisingera sp. HS039]